MEFPVTLRYKHYSVAQLDRSTWETVTIDMVDNFSLSLAEEFGYWGATLPVDVWSYAAGIKDVSLHEQASTEVHGTSEQVPDLNAEKVEISRLSGSEAQPTFKFLPCNFEVAKHPVSGYSMPMAGC